LNRHLNPKLLYVLLLLSVLLATFCIYLECYVFADRKCFW
jgi:hypothetical protein